MHVLDRLRSCDLFADLPASTLQLLADSSSIEYVTGGSTLFRQGEVGDAVYLVVLGRLCAVLEQDGGRGTRLGEIAPGEYVGEMALVASTPRGATVQALRDSTLICISAEAFLQTVQSAPEAALAVARTVIHRSRPSQRPRGDSFRTLAVVPSGASTAHRLRDFVGLLGQAMAQEGTVGIMDTAVVREVNAGGSQATDHRLSEREHEIEDANTFTIYSADNQNETWRERCIRNGDRILVVAGSDSPDSEREQVVHLLGRHERTSLAQVDLVMLHPDGRIKPGKTGPWLDTGLFSRHYHVRGAADINRLARLLTVSACGMALSGGGGRAYAFLGILKACKEAGISLDLFAGTSGGAIVGALAALELSQEELQERMWEFTRLWVYGDLGPPVVSLLSGKSASRLFQKIYGETLIEDLPVSFQPACTSLNTGELVVPQRGELWRAVRASTSLPGVFPPVPLGDDLLVDGGLVNNLPADLIRARSATVIGCDVSSALPLVVPPAEAYQVSGWACFWRMLNPFARRLPDTASFGSTVVRAAMAGARTHHTQMKSVVDTMIVPPVAGIGLLDNKPATFEHLFALGYQEGKASLDEKPAVAEPEMV